MISLSEGLVSISLLGWLLFMSMMVELGEIFHHWALDSIRFDCYQSFLALISEKLRD